MNFSIAIFNAEYLLSMFFMFFQPTVSCFTSGRSCGATCVHLCAFTYTAMDCKCEKKLADQMCLHSKVIYGTLLCIFIPLNKINTVVEKRRCLCTLLRNKPDCSSMKYKPSSYSFNQRLRTTNISHRSLKFNV